MLCLGLALAVCGVAAKVSVAEPPTSALCRIYIEGPNGFCIGSGTLVDVKNDRGLILTCWHTFAEMKPGDSIRVKFCGDAGNTWGALLIGVDQHPDLAALEIQRPPAPAPWLGVTPRYVEAAGFGGEGALAINRGEVIEVVGDTAGEMNQCKMTGLVRQGDSGGGVFDAKGRLVGVVNSITSSGSTIFCSAEEVARFLARYNVKPTRSETRVRTEVVIGGVIRQAPCEQMPNGQWTCPQPRQPIFPRPQQPAGNPMSPPFDPRPAAGSPYAEPAPAAANPCDCGDKWAANEQRLEKIAAQLAALDAKIARAPAPADLSGFAKKSDLPPIPNLAPFATRHEVAQLASSTATADKGLREQLRAAVGVLKETVAAGEVSKTAGLSIGWKIAGLIGLGSGPIGLAVAFATSIAVRRLGKRVLGRFARPDAPAFDPAPTAPPAAHPSPPAVAVRVDTPPLPQYNAVETRYYGYRTDDYEHAHAWAREQLKERYPIHREYIEVEKSLIAQKLNAQRPS